MARILKCQVCCTDLDKKHSYVGTNYDCLCEACSDNESFDLLYDENGDLLEPLDDEDIDCDEDGDW